MRREGQERSKKIEDVQDDLKLPEPTFSFSDQQPTSP
jgi:hypothetical protein